MRASAPEGRARNANNGMAQIAKDAGVGRESLYKTLSPGAHPRFETINSVLHALGVNFAVVSEHEG